MRVNNDKYFPNQKTNTKLKISPQFKTGELNLTFPFMLNPVTWDSHVFPVFFGGTKLDSNLNIESVPAIQLVYFATADTKKQDKKLVARTKKQITCN